MDKERLISAFFMALFLVGLPLGLSAFFVLVIYFFGAVAGVASFLGLLFIALVDGIYDAE